jgi:beta-glucosidase
VGSRDDRDVALSLARESIALLKNNNTVLPLSRNTKGILITGPSANSICTLNGGWTVHWQGCEDSELYFGSSIVSGVKQLIGSNQVAYVKGSDFDKHDPASLQQAIDIAKSGKVDHIIVAVGEPPYAEIFGNTNDLSLPEPQRKLIEAMYHTGIPVILVLVQGRPRTITWASVYIDAIIHAGLPGSEGGQAIADILFGEINPSGRLVVSYPSGPNFHNPYWHPLPEFDQYPEEPQVPLWQFGYGLSYTTFEYSDLQLSKSIIQMNDTLSIAVTVTNTGKVAGMESVLLFTRDVVASVVPAVKRLRRFDKISLQSGESRQVKFELNPMQDLGFIGLRERYVVEPGDFVVMIGPSSAKFKLTL